MNICIKLAVWYLISRLLQADENFWIVLFDKGHCLVDVLKLYKGATISCHGVRLKNYQAVKLRKNKPFVEEIRTSIDRNSEAMELSKRLS